MDTMQELFSAIDTYITRKYGPKIHLDARGHAKPLDGPKAVSAARVAPPSSDLAHALSDAAQIGATAEVVAPLNPRATREDGTIDWSLVR